MRYIACEGSEGIEEGRHASSFFVQRRNSCFLGAVSIFRSHSWEGEVFGKAAQRTETRSGWKEIVFFFKIRSIGRRPPPRRIFPQQIFSRNLELVEGAAKKSRRSLFPIPSTLFEDASYSELTISIDSPHFIILYREKEAARGEK